MRRADLRHYLRVLKGRWVEDPSNEDPSFDRTRMRRLLPLLAAEGLDSDIIVATAERLRSEAEALRLRAAQVWSKVGVDLPTAKGEHTGILILKPNWAQFCERATQRRLVAGVLQFVSSAHYSPRSEALEAFRDKLVSGGGATLHGCNVTFVKGNTLIFREYDAVKDIVATIGVDRRWDHRWRVRAEGFDGCQVRALGDAGWQQFAEKTQAHPPYTAALSLPSIWRGETLVACDGLGIGPGRTMTLCPDASKSGTFSSFLLSH
jgi:tRNA(Ile)-lysidine synthase